MGVASKQVQTSQPRAPKSKPPINRPTYDCFCKKLAGNMANGQENISQTGKLGNRCTAWRISHEGNTLPVTTAKEHNGATTKSA